MPLAIEIASAFLLSSGLGLVDFDSMSDPEFTGHRPGRLQWAYERNRSLDDIVDLLLDAVSDKENEAISLLTMSSFIGPNEVPISIFSGSYAAEESHLSEDEASFSIGQNTESQLILKCRDWLRRARENKRVLLTAVARLEELSLAISRKRPDGQISHFAVHNLVRKWSINRLKETEREELAMLIAHTVLIFLNPNVRPVTSRRDINLAKFALENIRCYVGDINRNPPQGRHIIQYGNLCAGFAQFYLRHKQHQDAAGLYSIALQCEALSKLSDQVSSLHYLQLLHGYGMSCWGNGDLALAVDAFQSLLRESSDKFGADHFAVDASKHLRDIQFQQDRRTANENQAARASRNSKLVSISRHYSPVDNLGESSASNGFESMSLPFEGTQPERVVLLNASYAGDESMVRTLLALDTIEADVKDESGRTPLWIAACRGHKEIVKLLLATGRVEVEVKDISGVTPLCVAVKGRHKAVIKLLLETRKFDIVKAVADCYIYDTGVMPLIFKVIDITQEMVSIIAERFDQQAMSLLLHQRGDQITISEEILKAVARNYGYSKEVMALLLDLRGDQITITEDVLKEAARNYGDGKGVMALLLHCGRYPLLARWRLSLMKGWART